jgi:hypothetical protein
MQGNIEWFDVDVQKISMHWFALKKSTIFLTYIYIKSTSPT